MDISKTGNPVWTGNNDRTSAKKALTEPKGAHHDSFSKSPENADAVRDPQKIRVDMFPQNPCIDKEPAALTLDREELGENLNGKRFKSIESEGEQAHSPTITADSLGNMKYDPSRKSEYVHVNVFIAATETLDLVESCLGHKVKWHSGKEQLPIESRVPDGRAEYDQHNGKEAIRFGYKSGAVDDENSYDGFSFDTVSHETGHAIIDGLRPYFDREEEDDRFFYYEQVKTYPNDNIYEYSAFNEAFADCASLLSMLQIEENLKQIALETKGDLKKESRLSMLSERRKGKDTPEIVALRSFINDLTYIPIDDPVLWNPSSQDALSIEPHSFARVFSGAIYDIFRGIYEKNLETPAGGGEPTQEAIVKALKSARDTLSPVFFKALDFSAPSGINYKSAASCMLKADKLLNNGENRELLERVFLARKIITAEDIKEWEGKDPSALNIAIEKFPGRSKEALQTLRDLRAGLKDLGIKTGGLNRAEVTEDKMGNRFIQYLAVKAVNVGKDILDYIDDGATLAFDKTGRLISIERFGFDNPEIIVDKNFASKDLPVPEATPPDMSQPEEVFKSVKTARAESKKIAGFDEYAREAHLMGDKFILEGDSFDITFVDKNTGETRAIPGVKGRVSENSAGDEIVASSDRINAVDLKTGEILWTADPAGKSHYSGAVFDKEGNLYVTSYSIDHKEDKNKLFKLDGKTGNVIWEVERSGKPPARPFPPQLSADGKNVIINTGRVFCVKGYKNPKAIAFDTGTGEEKWGFRVKDPVWSKVSNIDFDSNGNVILFCQQGEIHSLRNRTGAMRWSSKVERGILFYECLKKMPGDKALLQSTENVYSIDLKTGKELWSFPVKNVHSVASDKEGNAYVAAEAGIYKLDPKNGAVLQADLGYYASDLIVDDKGNLYAVSGKELKLITYREDDGKGIS